MGLILFNLVILALSTVGILFAFINYQIFFTLPLIFKVLLLIGILTPLINIYNTIQRFVILWHLLTDKEI